MKIAPIFYGSVKSGKLHINNRDKFDDYVRAIDGEVVITVKKKRKVRSLNQNGYYWVILTIAGDSLGYDPKELHDSFKAMFLIDNSTKVPLVRSTTKLSTSDFGKYIDNVIRKIAELNIVIPTPDDYYNSGN